MKLTSSLLATGALALVFTSALHAKIERVVEKTFTVQPGGRLTVATQGGNIQVEPGTGNEVKVTALQLFPKAKTEAEADEILKNLTLTIEQAGNDVSAVSKLAKDRLGMSWGRTPVTVSFVVTVPSRYHVDLKTSGGNLTVGDLTGEVLGRTSGGNVRLGRIDGPIDAKTSGGDISLKEGTGNTVLGTSGGNIRVERVLGDADLDTSGGDITVEGVEGKLDARTSGGNVRAKFATKLAGDCTLGTSGGNVTAQVAPGASFHLDASTSGGSVDATGLTITIEKGGAGKSQLVGSVNGGGPQLKLRTSGGDVRVTTK